MTKAPRRKPTLTPRERDIVEAIMTAASNKAIADKLGLTEQTVKNRLSALYRKLGVEGRLELALRMMKEGG
jgi:two-component system nitrate/nitrite response regulator NarL